MLTIEKVLDHEVDFDFDCIGAKEDLLFFDIETTGLSAYQAGLYLIGCVHFAEGSWWLVQYFAESVADEIPILKAFFDLLSRKKILLSFNGDGFDIPFINVMLSEYQLKGCDFSQVKSIDLYKCIKPYKKLLGLPNCKLKTCEQFLGIFREDIFSGGELIYVYYDYLKTKEEEKLQTLLLHNAEDLENLPRLLPLLNYQRVLQEQLTLAQCSVVTLDAPAAVFCDGEEDSTEGALCKVLDLVYTASVCVPKSIDVECSRYTLNLSGNRVNLCVRMYEGELKYFFPDYKNYYYLAVEDCAVHKSVAEFMDAQYRTKATAKNCYMRKAGLYLPMLKPIFSPAFYKEYKGKVAYAAYTPELFANGEKALAYLRSFLEKCR